MASLIVGREARQRTSGHVSVAPTIVDPQTLHDSQRHRLRCPVGVHESSTADAIEVVGGKSCCVAEHRDGPRRVAPMSPRGDNGGAMTRYLYYGWIVLAAAFAIISLSIGTLFMLGVFLKPIEDSTGWSRAAIAAIGLVNWAAMGLGGVV